MDFLKAGGVKVFKKLRVLSIALCVTLVAPTVVYADTLNVQPAEAAEVQETVEAEELQEQEAGESEEVQEQKVPEVEENQVQEIAEPEETQTQESEPVEAQEIEPYTEEAEEAVISFEKSEFAYSVSVSSIGIAGIDEVRYAVWSDTDWQDDLKWYTGSYDAESQTSSLAYKSSDFKTYGKYYVDVYGVNSDGEYIFIVGTTYSVSAPSAESTVVNADNASGKFTASAQGVTSEFGMQKVQVAVWSDEGWQDDLVWYDLSSQDGIYTVSSDISKHGYDTGLYYFDFYVKESNGNMGFIGGVTYTFSGTASEPVVEKTASGYTVSISDIIVPGGIKEVKYAIWSDEGWQDDLKWYDGSYKDGTSSLSYKASDFGSLGKYYVDIYGYNASGSPVYIGGLTYNVSAASASDSSISTVNSDGSFKVTVSGVTSDLGINKVQVAVWSDKNWQDDLVWYTMSKQSDSYVFSGNISKHGYDTGLYYFDIYVQDGSGNMQYVAGETAEFAVKASDISVKASKENVKYDMSVSGVEIPGALSKVQFAVWSDKNWQDDLKWYDASKSGDSYNAVLNISNHKTEGKYYIDVYAKTTDGKMIYIDGTTINVSASAKAEVSIANINDEKGTFDVYMSVTESSLPVSKVQLAVWSNNNWQDDVRWYTAEKQSDGKYKVSISAANHNYDSGKYYLDVYAVLENGVMKCANSITHNVDGSKWGTIGDRLVRQYAREIINATGGDLEQAFWWVVNNLTYTAMPVPQSYPEGYTRQQYYFVYAYQNRSGNCYNFAATFYWVAKELGYDCKLIEARCHYASGAHGAHGWVEVYRNGTTYVCDPQITYQSRAYTTYMLTYASAPLTYYRNEAPY